MTEGRKLRAGKRTPGERSREILEAAKKILVEEGYAELTLRRIARSLGISLSTVQYYYGSREALIEAVIAKRIALYKAKRTHIKKEVKSKEAGQIRDFFRFLLADSLSEETCCFFTQVWALGFQNTAYKKQLCHMYAEHREELTILVAELRPDLNAQACLQCATVVSSMIEGSLLHLGVGMTADDSLAGVREKMLDSIMLLIKNW